MVKASSLGQKELPGNIHPIKFSYVDFSVTHVVASDTCSKQQGDQNRKAIPHQSEVASSKQDLPCDEHPCRYLGRQWLPCTERERESIRSISRKDAANKVQDSSSFSGRAAKPCTLQGHPSKDYFLCLKGAKVEFQRRLLRAVPVWNSDELSRPPCRTASIKWDCVLLPYFASAKLQTWGKERVRKHTCLT